MIVLYRSENCPYCQKVVRAFEDLNVQYEIQEVETPDQWKSLEHLGGKMQVPYLVDTEKDISLYESEDIIQHIKDLYQKNN